MPLSNFSCDQMRKDDLQLLELSVVLGGTLYRVIFACFSDIFLCKIMNALC